MKEIEARKIFKKYQNKSVVNAVEFCVNKDECFGLLGPNGAGKSTAMKMMYCSVNVDDGDLYVRGLNVKENPKAIKAQIGVVPQDNGLDLDFSVLENLLIYGKYFGIKHLTAKAKARELLRFMKLDEYENYEVEKLSGGMMRRLAIARALMSDPKILFLDEPTTGLDPQVRLWVWEALRELKKSGTTIVLTTHYMEEAENLCDRILLMDHGKVLCEGKPSELIEQNIGYEVVEMSVNPEDHEYYGKKLKGKYEFQKVGSKIRIFIRSGQMSKEALNLVDSRSIHVRRSSLDDVFLKLAGYELKGKLI